MPEKNMKFYLVLIASFAFVVLMHSVETATAAKTPVCSVDVSAAPELSDFAKQLPPLCEKNYPKIRNILSSPGFKPPDKVKLIFRRQDEPGVALGDTIYLSIDWFKKYPDDLGAIVHELAHVVQSYPANQPFWLQEGIADYIRYDLGYQNASSKPRCVQQFPHYTSGYWCSAAFLGFVEKNYKSKNVVNTINAKLRSDLYCDIVFKELTGKRIEQLWQDCLLADCKGGNP
jgi:hypothetical protein